MDGGHVRTQDPGWRVRGSHPNNGVAEKAFEQWQLERARIMMSIEQELSVEWRRRKENRFWVSLPGENPGEEVDYLQVNK